MLKSFIGHRFHRERPGDGQRRPHIIGAMLNLRRPSGGTGVGTGL